MSERVIKFRAWFKGQMVPVHYLFLQFQPPSASSDLVPGNLGQCPIMQFTGLFDSEGKEIYEGDILEYAEKPNGYCIVQWHEFGYVAAWPNHKSVAALNHTEIMRVAGNRFEHPDLLAKHGDQDG